VLTAGLVVVLINFRLSASLSRRLLGRVSRRDIRTAAMFAVPIGLIAAVAIWNAAVVNYIKVEQILNDPAAVHISPKSSEE
jgi:hypothetical protein